MAQRISIRTTLARYYPNGQLPKLTDQELEPYVEQYLSGDASMRNYIIEARMRLALAVAGKWARKRRNKADDIGGEALYQLVKAVDLFPQKAKNLNISPFICSRIWNGLREYLAHDYVVRIPKATVTRKLANGEEVPFFLQKPVPLQTIIDAEKNRYGNSQFAKMFSTSSFKAISVPPDTDKIEEKDLLNTEIPFNEHRHIFELRLQGFNDRDIAGMLNISVSHVQRVREEVMNRLSYIVKALE